MEAADQRFSGTWVSQKHLADRDGGRLQEFVLLGDKEKEFSQDQPRESTVHSLAAISNCPGQSCFTGCLFQWPRGANQWVKSGL